MKQQEKKHDKQENKSKKKTFAIIIAIIIIVIGSIALYDYWTILQSRVYIEKSQVIAPLITLSPQSTGVLESIFVKEGDSVQKNMIIAIVGTSPIRAKTDGIITSVQNTPGQTITTSGYVAKMIDPSEFRVVGKVQEDKGLRDIKIGQKVIFTIDAYDNKEYTGFVESISPISSSQDIVFSISDKRQENEFNVYVKFDVNAYPELKSGMSAKMWVYK